VVVAGARRTAEELGRAFPGAQVLTSGGATVLADVAAEPAVVVATPGAEPVAARGYAAAVLLDGWALLSRPSLDAAQETLRRWMNAAALVVPAGAGGRVVVVADAGLAPVQALVRWDAVTCAERELAERTTLGFPPAVRMAAVTGVPEAVDDLLSATPLPGAAQLLGPVPAEDDGLVRVLVRVPRNQAAALATALKTGQAHRSARKAGGQVRVRIDPAAPA
jgi:primosomal protein N' (replication factor Y)